MRRGVAELPAIVLAAVGILLIGARVESAQSLSDYRFHIERQAGSALLAERFTPAQIAILEKVNRADAEQLGRLPELVIPEAWRLDDLAYAPLPTQLASENPPAKLIVAFLPGQLFGAYEFGTMVRWGPLSSGGRYSPTPPGSYNLAWRSTGRWSTINPSWFLPWYFNFGNREGLAFHQFVLPGLPASHGCVRLLERDARWLFEWGDGWTMDAGGGRITKPGTPVWIVGHYDFDAPPPWRSPAWLARTVDLPPIG